jgi:hypothetical protein
MIRHVLLACCCAFGLAACFPAVTEYSADPQTHKFTKKTYKSDADFWKAQVERRIEQELAGKKADGGSPTWKAYWTNWYANIRRDPSPPWKDSELKTSEDMIRYMKERRKAHGLPPYD